MNISTLNNISSAYPITTKTKTPVSRVKPIKGLSRYDKEYVIYDKTSTEVETLEKFEQITYKNPVKEKLAKEKLADETKSKAKERTDDLEKLVERIFTKQCMIHSTSKDELDSSDKNDINIAIEIFDAKNYWGINETSDRILNFTIALSEGDTTKADDMTEVIKLGYEQAKKHCKETFPDICEKTLYTTVTKIMNWKYSFTKKNDNVNTDSDSSKLAAENSSIN